MSVPDLEGVLPAVGVTLPSGSALTTGTLDANLAIAGPTDKLVITGPIKLANGTIKGFSVSSKLGALGSFAGLGGNKSSDTVIESLTTNVRVEPAGTHAQDLNVVIQGIGSVTGDANVDAAGKLDCCVAFGRRRQGRQRWRHSVPRHRHYVESNLRAGRCRSGRRTGEGRSGSCSRWR
jgi:AsmA protein